MTRVQWVAVCWWEGDPGSVQQVYGPFPTKKAARAYLRTFDKSWRGEIFPLYAGTI